MGIAVDICFDLPKEFLNKLVEHLPPTFPKELPEKFPKKQSNKILKELLNRIPKKMQENS